MSKRRGYRREQFSDAWVRYLDPPSIRPSEVSEASQVSQEGESKDTWDGKDASSERNKEALALSTTEGFSECDIRDKCDDPLGDLF